MFTIHDIEMREERPSFEARLASGFAAMTDDVPDSATFERLPDPQPPQVYPRTPPRSSGWRRVGGRWVPCEREPRIG